MVNSNRHFAVGAFGFTYNNNQVIDYMTRFGLDAPFAVDKFLHGAQNLSEVYDFGTEELVFKFSTKELSVAMLTRQLGLSFAVASAGNPTDILIPDESGVVPPPAGPYTITLAQTPIAGSLVVHAILGGIDTEMAVVAGAPADGECQWAAGTTTTFNAAQTGVTIHFSYYYASTSVGVAAATTPTSYVPPAVSGYGFLRLGPQNPTGVATLVFKATNLQRAGGGLAVDVEKNKIQSSMDLQYAVTTSSTLKWSILY